MILCLRHIPPDISENHKEDKFLINPVEYELYSSRAL